MPYLIPQRSQRHVRPLWNVEQLAGWRFGHLPAPSGPQLPKNAEQTALAAAVRSTHQHIHAGFDLEVQILYQYVTVRSDQRYVLEADDVVLELHQTLAGTNFGIGHTRIADHRSLVPSGVQVLQHHRQLGHPCGEASQAGHFATSQHQASDGFRQFDQHPSKSVVSLEKKIASFS